MDKNKIVILVLIIFLVISVLQAFQINELKQQFVNSGLSLSGSVIQSSTLRQSPSKNTPTMVGGC